MNNAELVKQQQKINYLFDKTRSLPSDDVELHSHWARYLCVVCAGFIENSLKEILKAYVVNCANPAVANYASRNLNRIQNPKTKRFIEVAGQFKPDWGNALGKYAEDENRNNGIDSIMANRHNIAHGKNSGITIGRLRNYFAKSLEIIEFLENQCEGQVH